MPSQASPVLGSCRAKIWSTSGARLSAMNTFLTKPCMKRVAPSLNFVLLTADPTSTTKTDNAAYSLNAADAFKVRKTIPVTTLYDHGTPNEYSSGGINLVVKPNGAGDILYGLLIDGTGVTLTSTSDVQVRMTGIPA